MLVGVPEKDRAAILTTLSIELPDPMDCARTWVPPQRSASQIHASRVGDRDIVLVRTVGGEEADIDAVGGHKLMVRAKQSDAYSIC
jgi:hypothetical protein